VLYHGTAPWEHIPEMDDLIEIAPGMKTGLLDYLLIFVDITPLLRGQFKGHPVLQTVLESLQLGTKGELADNFEQVIERLLIVKDDPRMGGWLPSLGFYAMSVDDIDMEQVAKAFSKVVNTEEANRMAQTTAEKLLIEGEAKASRELILAILRERFGKVPKNIERAINQMNDPIALKSLAVRTASCKTLDEFTEEL